MKEKLLTINRKTLQAPLLIFFIFTIVAITIWQVKNNIFFLFNFLYIGTSVAVGIFLSNALVKKHKQWGRRIAQFLVGLYMLGYLGIMNGENVQIEGFFFYLIAGFFAGATIHYLVAKIAGPVLFGRGWCGWACWTSMVLDLLPWRKPARPRIKYLGLIRYLHFAASLGLVLVLYFVFEYRYGSPFASEKYRIMGLTWVLAGNALYYVLALLLAAIMKDNRAFCKYVCPIPSLQKLTSRFSLLKMKVDTDSCVSCRLCEKNCPMDIKILDYARENSRVLSTECIICNTCADTCPRGAISMSIGLDTQISEYISKRSEVEQVK